MIPQAAAALARAMTAASYRRFRTALAEPERAQAAVRTRIEGALPQCAYGRRHGARMSDLPIVRHEDLRTDIAAMRSGARDILWPGAVARWMTTSGSSGAKKPIPITPTLQRVFSHALGLWAHDVLTHLYRPRTGKLFMALAPPRKGEPPEDEAAFLGPLAPLARAFLVAPRELAAAPNAQVFREQLAQTLLRERNLELISLWSPTYLLALMDVAGERDWRETWPSLRFISAWDSAAAAGPAAELQRRLPHAILQGKGLISTEAPATIPLHDSPAPAPLVDAIYYEFRDYAGAIRPLTDVDEDEDYTLILSTPGGFLRYDTGDVVRVCNQAAHTPCLRFMRRADAVSDLVGEKLAENIAAQALCAVLGERSAILLPVLDPPHYVLLAETVTPAEAQRVDSALAFGRHYARARDLAQLGQLDAHATPNLRARLIAAAEAEGQSMESIKDRALIPDAARAARLLARLLERD